MYAKVGVLAVDYPDLDLIQQRVEIVIQLGLLQPPEVPQAQTSVFEPSSGEVETDVVRPSRLVFFWQNQKNRPVFFIIAAIFCLVALLYLVRVQMWPLMSSPVVQEVPAVPESLPSGLVAASLTQQVVERRNSLAPPIKDGNEDQGKLRSVEASPALTTAEPQKISPAVDPASVSLGLVSVSQDDEIASSSGPERDKTPGVSAGPARIYIVQPGDTLESIALKLYGKRYKWSRLVNANKEKLGIPPYRLSPGMHLQVPLPGEKLIPVLNEDGTYSVQSGDSLGSIALKLYGTTGKWEALYQLNRDQLHTPGALQVGQKLRVNVNILGVGNRIRSGSNP